MGFPTKKPFRLTPVEAAAVRAAVKVYVAIRARDYSRLYALGYRHGIKTMADCLPFARMMARNEKRFAKLDRILAGLPKS